MRATEMVVTDDIDGDRNEIVSEKRKLASASGLVYF
jgi:hypothetical protein